MVTREESCVTQWMLESYYVQTVLPGVVVVFEAGE